MSPFFDCADDIRRVIYTTNVVEALHRCIRRTTKTKGIFVTEQALEKQLNLTIMHNQRSWKRKVKGWPEMAKVFQREFPDRFPTGVD